MAVLDLANCTIEVKLLHIYFVVSVILHLDANLFYLFIICLRIYIYSYLCIYSFIYLLFRYTIFIFLSFYPEFSLIWSFSFIYVNMCMCELDIDGDLAWCLMEAVFGQTGITLSCIQHIIQVYLN